MFKKSIILLFLLLSNALSAQWIEQSSGTTQHLLGVNFIDSMTGVAVGNNGTILKTTDGGVHWNTIPSPSNKTYWKNHFVNETLGWIVGVDGTLLKTLNTGDSWDTINLGTDEDLESIFFINDSVGWLCGRNGVLYKTENQGITWEDKSFNQTDYLGSIVFFDDNKGFIGGLTTSYKTDDGGITWDTFDLIVNKSILDFCFIDNQIGWFCGEDGMIYKTEDGGNLWIEQQSNINEWFQEIDFVDANFGWAVGRHGKMVYTIDGGDNWVPYLNPMASNQHIISVDFTDKRNGWAVAVGGAIIKYSQDPTLNTTSFSNQTLNIYPNPISETSTIQFSQANSEVQLALYDINGRNLGSSFFNKTQDRQYEFTRGVLASGLYYIVVENQDSVWSEKIVLE